MKYDNIVNFLSDYEIVTQMDEFYKEKKIEFKCKLNHINTLTSNSFSNKKTKIPAEDFCTTCKKIKELEIHTEEFVSKIKLKSGHIVLSVNFSTRVVIYECFTCKTECKTFIGNLLKSNGVCSQCQNDKNKLDFKYIQSQVSQQSMVLLTKKEDYVNNKQKLKLLCICGNFHDAVLSDIKRGKKCIICKLEKCKKTCIERYGADNVSKVPEIYKKILRSSFYSKKFVFPKTKREIWVMGYEPQAVLWMLAQKCDPLLNRIIEEDDITNDIINFSYENHVYFPDFMFKETKIIIEVKSIYIFNKDHHKNKLKFQTVVNHGYILRLIMFDEKMIVKDYVCKTLIDIDELFEIYRSVHIRIDPN